MGRVRERTKSGRELEMTNLSLNLSKWQRSMMNAPNDAPSTSLVFQHRQARGLSVTEKMWTKTLQSNRELVDRFRSMRGEKESLAERNGHLYQRNTQLMLENSELRGRNTSNRMRPDQLDTLRRVFALQQEAAQECGDLLSTVEHNGASENRSANSSCMSSLQSGDITNERPSMAAPPPQPTDNDDEESQLNETEPMEATVEADASVKSSEGPEMLSQLSIASSDNENSKASEDEEESDDDFDPANFKMRKSAIHGRQSMAPTQNQQQPAPIEKRKAMAEKRKTVVAAKGTRKRSSIAASSSSNKETADQMQPASKRKSIRKTINRRTVNFGFGLDDSVSLDDSAYDNETEVTLAAEEANKENILAEAMKTPPRSDDPDIETSAGTRSSRRNRKQVSYAEPKGNAKMRRGDAISHGSLVQSFSPTAPGKKRKTKKSKK